MNPLLRILRSTVVLVSLLLLCAGRSVAQPADVRFENETIPSGTYEATQTVSARNATVQSGSNVTFRAGQTVRLEAGFKAELGASFGAEVDPDVGSGGGDLVLDDLPPNGPNGRFYDDQFEVVRPALSLRGFDSGGFPEGNGYGYGLKQVLERAYAGIEDPNDLVYPVFEEIIFIANEEPSDPEAGTSSRARRSIVNRNTVIMQSRAFVALATYVLEENGYTADDYQITPGPPDPTSDLYIPPHEDALANFKAVLLTPPAGDRFTNDGDRYGKDRVQWTRSFSNYARALDLYLALENAYAYFDGPEADLLTRQEKETLLSDLCYGAERLHTVGINGILPEEAEPGNRPMKLYVAAGYGILTSQDVGTCADFHDDTTFPDPFNPQKSFEGLLRDAFFWVSPALAERELSRSG